MGILGCQASFQRPNEKFMDNISNIIVYINNLFFHSQTHEQHLETLELVMQRLEDNHMKTNVSMFFGNTDVSYLRFRLTGIKPGK
jgi:hypothetical protein